MLPGIPIDSVRAQAFEIPTGRPPVTTPASPARLDGAVLADFAGAPEMREIPI